VFAAADNSLPADKDPVVQLAAEADCNSPADKDPAARELAVAEEVQAEADCKLPEEEVQAAGCSLPADRVPVEQTGPAGLAVVRIRLLLSAEADKVLPQAAELPVPAE
jgi:hypothetical protein